MSDSGMVGECLTLSSQARQLAVDPNEQATCSLLGVALMACSEAEFSNSVLSSSLFDMTIKTFIHSSDHSHLLLTLFIVRKFVLAPFRYGNQNLRP